MKRILFTTCLSFAIFSSLTSDGQSVMLTKMSKPHPNALKDEFPVCFNNEELTSISDKMYKDGNPKYIWVDLIKDGLITPGDQTGYHLYLHLKDAEEGGNVTINTALQKAYVAKWGAFMKHIIKEPVNKEGSYHIHLSRGIVCKEISDQSSEFRAITKGELSNLGLNTKGELILMESILKDGLADASKPLVLNLSPNGYYVNGKRLTVEEHEKYRKICLEEFGTDYNRLGEYWQSGPGENRTLGGDIAKLKKQVEEAKTINND